MTITRELGTFSLDQAVQMLQKTTMALPEVERIGERALDIDGTPGYALEVAYLDAGAGTLVQTHRLATVASSPVVDLVHLVATCSGDAIERDLLEIRGCADSLRLRTDEPPPD